MKDILFTFFNYFVFFYTSMLAISFIVFAFLSFISLKRRKVWGIERSGFFNDRGKWVKGFENQRV